MLLLHVYCKQLDKIPSSHPEIRSSFCLYSFCYAACSISQPGFWGKDCQNICQCPISECSSVNGCSSCNNPGWKGTNCDQDVNECLNQLNSCPENSRCLNTNGSFLCECQPWYQMTLDKCTCE